MYKYLFDEPEEYPVSMFTDSSTAMSILETSKSSERNKHINVKLQYLRKLVKTVVVNVMDVSTKMHPADILNKSVDADNLQRHRFVCRLQY